jgi:hypothetical protein
MSRKQHSLSKQLVVVAALALGTSGVALADDSSMNMWTGDSYAYFNGGRNFPDGKPVLDYGPSTYRPTPPQDAPAYRRQHFPIVNAVDSSASSIAGSLAPPHDQLPRSYTAAPVLKSASN